MRTLDSVDLRGEPTLVRVDFNVPLDDQGAILDDSRIRAALPTIQYLLERNCPCILMTHLGKPGGERVEKLQVGALAERLSELLPDNKVLRTDEVVGDRVQEKAQALKNGEVLLLENLRFHPGEKKNDADFAAQLAKLAKIYVNDAFAACHREHASVHAVTKKFPPEKRAIGLLVQRELDALGPILNSPPKPFIAVFGGAKVSDKLATVRALTDKVDRILIGGAMAYTLMKARGDEVGESKVEEDKLDAARDLLNHAGDKLWLPSDHVVAEPNGENQSVRADIPEGFAGFDIGPETVSRYQQEIQRAHTILWNGPMGKIEEEAFVEGTRKVAEAIAGSDATSVAGGGETTEVIHRFGLEERMNHVSTGGGAFLTYIAKGSLPALEPLDEG